MQSIDELIKTIAKLRAPDGCPWDKEQTHKSLKRYLIEEVYETLEAIDKGESMALMEELGDVLLQVVLHAQIASESKQFSFDDLVKYINKKMVLRHPHVFSDTVVKNTEEVMVNWEAIKNEEKPGQEIFDGVPIVLPALLKALKVSKKVARCGFEWESETNLWEAFNNELNEFKDVAKSNEKKDIQSEELGDLLFMLVNIARWYKLDPEDALRMAIDKFINRFKKVLKLVKTQGKEIKNLSSSELDGMWQLVKLRDKSKNG